MDSPEFTLPRLRADLRFTPLTEKGTPHYILEDPVRNKFYRLGLEEYLFISRLNQSSSIEQLLQGLSQTAETQLSLEQAEAIFNWLAARQLLQLDNASPLIKALEQEQMSKNWQRLSRLNLITIRISLFNPDPLLNVLSPKLSWLTGKLFAFIWLALAISALGILFSRWQEFSAQSVGFFSAGNLIVIWLIWFSLKLFHELFHALVCRRYGGRVYDAGFLFILFIPLTYVNATSSWNFPSKWQRIHVAIAGMFIELGIAWVALLVWAGQPGTAIGLIAHNTVIIAGISSLLFNANPLMRFDGYYVLSDLTAIPNLYSHGLQVIRAAGAKWFLGISPTPSTQSWGRKWFIRMYGVGIYVWRLFILLSLGYIASSMAGGFGIMATFGAAIVWLGMPLYLFYKRLPLYRQQNPSVVTHLLLRFIITVVCIGLVASVVSWEQRIKAPAVIEYQHQFSVRPEIDGFVAAVHVTEGQLVEQGELLITLKNDQLVYAANLLELETQQLELESRLAQSNNQLTQLQIIKEQQQTSAKELQDLQRDLAALTIYAHHNGVVIGSDLATFQGTYVPQGKELFWIVNKEQKHIIASASQDDVDQFQELVNKPIDIDMRSSGLGLFSGTLKQVSPTATAELLHPALGAVYGGPLDVRQQAIGGSGKDMEQYYRFELFAPRFKLDVELPRKVAEKVKDGQPATLYIRGGKISLGQTIVKWARSWLEKRNSPID
ncbi:MAG: biotin/lipoyl-binding protein [Desulfobacterales bacterium]|nr:biotin/lipoyl-binding protein [Desulfobacterales bacterium]